VARAFGFLLKQRLGAFDNLCQCRDGQILKTPQQFG
jgi:hypothetical protein